MDYAPHITDIFQKLGLRIFGVFEILNKHIKDVGSQEISFLTSLRSFAQCRRPVPSPGSMPQLEEGNLRYARLSNQPGPSSAKATAR
jgi:hypothetical protein